MRLELIGERLKNLVCLAAFSLPLAASIEDASSATYGFQSPIHFPMTLAGNFGEPRPNHFHGGIDVKTDHVEGKPVYAIGEGYVAKASVGLNGFGNAVYIRHPNGRTSVYAHLREFAPKIAVTVKRYQRLHQEHGDTCEIEFPASQMPVSRGQFIAFSGNTGASTGPHLHLEVHETRSSNMLDPLEFLKAYVDDRVPPQILGIKAYPKQGEGSFATGSVFYPTTTGLYAWGKVGFAVRAEDYMDSVPNRYGIRFIRFYADDKLVFSSDVNGIPVEDNPLVNIWGDSIIFQTRRQWFLKSFIEPENTLPILTADENRGYVVFDEERPYRLKYVLSDIFGNTTEKEFVVMGRKRKLKNEI
ncbi:MAG: M23 family metallopeptidase [Prevotella sp.]|nr:M23 family metallopeptidase [Prevotella sp.]